MFLSEYWVIGEAELNQEKNSLHFPKYRKAENLSVPLNIKNKLKVFHETFPRRQISWGRKYKIPLNEA